MSENYIISVDEDDREIGRIEKMEAHMDGRLHRAFSVFVFNSKGQLILQKRSDSKYHSGGLWTNTCCSHPAYGENLTDAVTRRLKEEMGLTCKTEKIFHFIYRAELDRGLVEHELDHVFFGMTDDTPVPNPSEASLWKYADMDELKNDISEFPERYTVWLQICFEKVYMEWKSRFH